MNDDKLCIDLCCRESRAVRAEMPLGLSQAILEAVELDGSA